MISACHRFGKGKAPLFLHWLQPNVQRTTTALRHQSTKGWLITMEQQNDCSAASAPPRPNHRVDALHGKNRRQTYRIGKVELTDVAPSQDGRGICDPVNKGPHRRLKQALQGSRKTNQKDR